MTFHQQGTIEGTAKPKRLIDQSDKPGLVLRRGQGHSLMHRVLENTGTRSSFVLCEASILKTYFTVMRCLIDSGRIGTAPNALNGFDRSVFSSSLPACHYDVRLRSGRIINPGSHSNRQS